MRVLVTGAASGIGAATCRVLAAAGWEPVATDVDSLDVTDEAAWDATLDAAWPLDGLVNCAGIRTRSDIVDTDVETFARHMQVNVTGSWLGIRGVMRRHAPGERRAIVNIASINATQAISGQAHYVASKGAVAMLTKAAALEGADAGIRVNAVAPGLIDTPMTAERLADPDQVAWMQRRVPMSRAGAAEEVGSVVRFLLSEEASYVSGAVVHVDGGWVASAQ